MEQSQLLINLAMQTSRRVTIIINLIALNKLIKTKFRPGDVQNIQK